MEIFEQDLNNIKDYSNSSRFSLSKCLGVSLSVVDQFSQKKGPGAFNLNRFWEHSADCGIASRMLAKISGYRSRAEAFVAGLLHDIGKLVIFQYFPREFDEILLLVNEEGMSFLEAERTVLDVTHPEIGWWLAETWNLPKELIDGIAHHHQPAAAENHPEIAMMVHLSDILCKMFQMGSGGDELIPDVAEDAVTILAKTHPMFHGPGDLNLDSYESRFKEEVEDSETFLSLIKAE